MKKLRCLENKWERENYPTDIHYYNEKKKITKGKKREKERKRELKYNRCRCHYESPVDWEAEKPGSGLGFATNYLSNLE